MLPVTALYEYIDSLQGVMLLHKTSIQQDEKNDHLPDNFFLIEDVLKLAALLDRAWIEDKTLVGTIFSILQSYALYEDLSVDRTFEPIGKVV